VTKKNAGKFDFEISTYVILAENTSHLQTMDVDVPARAALEY
jgi:hypothetical protein